MEPPNTVQIVLLFVLIALSAFFSASETAFSSVNRIRLKNYAASGNRRAVKALHISDHYDRALSAILIGNNIVNIASASIGTVLFTAWFGPSGVGIPPL
ncbi:MAG: CNNM domain-containing protein [Oscillospiraceae bacterium]